MSEVTENRVVSAPELLLIAYRALGPGEQDQAFDLINRARVERLAGEDSEAARMIKSLCRVADLLGEAPGIEDYKRIRRELQADGEQLQPTSRILKHFDGSWHLAKEAIGLAETNTARRIESRFAQRRLGKIWRYSEQSLRDALAACVTDLGHVPQVAEFEHWRHRELELATARGDELHLPSATPYRRRYGNWEKALLTFGYSIAAINGRLEQ
jgi:hypothetical protein